MRKLPQLPLRPSRWELGEPVGTIALISFINTAGSGLWLVSSTLYLTRVAHLRPAEVGIGLGAAALLSLVTSTPMGYLADRVKPRVLQIAFFWALAVFYTGMLTVHSFATFIVVACLAALADAGQRGARGSIIGGVIPKADRVRARAVFRSAANAGLAIGAAGAGAALMISSPMAYYSLIIGNGVSYLLVALLAMRVPDVPIKSSAKDHAGGKELAVLRDYPFLAYSVLDGIISIHNSILLVILPLWIVTFTHAPHWAVAACVVTDTVVAVLLQVRMSRDTEELDGAARAARTGGILIAASCCLFAFTSGIEAAAATACLLAATILHVLGELRHSASGWAISFGLAPEHLHGQYQGVYTTGQRLGHTIAPTLLIWLVIGMGRAGWLAVAIVVIAPSLCIAPLVRWGSRRQAAASQPEQVPAI